MGYVYGQGSTDPAWDAADARRRKQRRTAGLGQALQHLSGLWLQHQLSGKQMDKQQEHMLERLTETQRLRDASPVDGRVTLRDMFTRPTMGYGGSGPVVGLPGTIPGMAQFQAGPMEQFVAQQGVNPDAPMTIAARDQAVRQFLAGQHGQELAGTPVGHVGDVPGYTGGGLDALIRRQQDRTEPPDLRPGTPGAARQDLQVHREAGREHQEQKAWNAEFKSALDSQQTPPNIRAYLKATRGRYAHMNPHEAVLAAEKDWTDHFKGLGLEIELDKKGLFRAYKDIDAVIPGITRRRKNYLTEAELKAAMDAFVGAAADQGGDLPEWAR